MGHLKLGEREGGRGSGKRGGGGVDVRGEKEGGGGAQSDVIEGTLLLVRVLTQIEFSNSLCVHCVFPVRRQILPVPIS